MDLALAVLILAWCFLTGETLCRACRTPFSSRAESFLVSSLAGVVVLSYLTTLAGFLGALQPEAMWGIFLAPLILRVRRLAGWIRSVAVRIRQTRAAGTPLPPVDDELARFNLGVLALLGLMALAQALAPPTATDTLVYHLAIPKAYLEAGRIVNLPNNMFSFFPLHMEMVYLFSLALGGETLPQLVGLGITFLLLGGLTLYFRRRFAHRYSLLVPVLYFSTPTFFKYSSAAYVDLPVAAFIFFSWYAWERWRESRAVGWFFLLSIFSAAAVATKLTTAIVLSLVAFGILWDSRDRGTHEGLLMRCVLFALAVTLLLFPWFGKNFYFTGNPFAPFFMDVLGGDGEGINWDTARSASQGQYYQIIGMGHGWLDFLLLPVNLTFFSEPSSTRFDGQIGVLYFLLIPAILGVRKKDLPLIGVSGVLLVFWFLYFQFIRMLAPAFVFLTLVLVGGLERLTRPRTSQPETVPSSGRLVFQKPGFGYLVPASLAMGVLFNLGLAAGPWLQSNPAAFLMGRENREDYMAHNIPAWPIYQSANRLTPPGAVILMVYMRNFGYLMERKFISDSLFEAHTLQHILKTDPSPEGIARQLKTLQATHLMFDKDYVFGPGSAFTPPEQTALISFLTESAERVDRKNGFYLYRFMLD